MKKLLLAATATALMAPFGLAHAEEANGRIQTYDPAANMIVLEDGSTYALAEGVTVDNLQPGQEVTVSFEQDSSGNLVATSVAPAE